MSESESRSTGVFDVDRIKQLVALMKEHDLSEIDLREDEHQIRLCRRSEVVAAAPQPAPLPPAPAAPAAPPAPAAPAVPAASPPTAADEAHIAVITSPIVGTFYSRPNPKSESFVKVGDNVDVDTTVCIIEAMKVFNEIPAEVRGKIVAVLVDEEEAVDFGKPLFKVDTRQ